MGNPENGEVTLKIGDKSYTMTLKTAGLVALQKRLSPAGEITPLQDVLTQLDAAIRAQSIEHIVIFFWAALRRYHPDVTEAKAMDLIDDLGGIGGLNVKLTELQIATMPDGEDVKELTQGGNPPKARAKARGTGERSVSAHA